MQLGSRQKATAAKHLTKRRNRFSNEMSNPTRRQHCALPSCTTSMPLCNYADESARLEATKLKKGLALGTALGACPYPARTWSTHQKCKQSCWADCRHSHTSGRKSACAVASGRTRRHKIAPPKCWHQEAASSLRRADRTKQHLAIPEST